MAEPKLSSRGIAFIHNPLRAARELGMTIHASPDDLLPYEVTHGDTADRPFPWKPNERKKKHKKKRNNVNV